jgi:micrococcal nuclease
LPMFISDGRMLNQEIVRAGYAQLMTIPPNVKYQDVFLRLSKEAH